MAFQDIVQAVKQTNGFSAEEVQDIRTKLYNAQSTALSFRINAPSLMLAFSWGSTPEGHHFWRLLHHYFLKEGLYE